MVAEHYRREAQLIEQAARCVSLRSDREELLAEARSLRRRAEIVEQWERATHPTGPGAEPPKD